jgi:hypothetical protein
VRCAAGCCIKSVKKCISRARAPRGRDAWVALIDIKSDSREAVESPAVDLLQSGHTMHRTGLRLKGVVQWRSASRALKRFSVVPIAVSQPFLSHSWAENGGKLGFGL